MWRPRQPVHWLACALLTVNYLANAGAADENERPLKPKIMAAETEAELRQLLPAVDDPDLQQILRDPRLLLYTEKEMPRCYQDWSGALQGVHAASYNISANDSEPHGNGNVEFPWGAPGGTHRAKNVSSFRFLWLPLDEQGQTRPVVWYRHQFAGDRAAGYGWTFPVGAVVGEVLLLNRPDGGRVAFEMRTRTRLDGEWDVNALRPFPRAEELAQRICELRPDWETRPSLQLVVSHLTQPLALPTATLTSQHADRVPFRQEMGIDVLPSLDDQSLVTQLLTQTPFRSALGEDWRVDSAGHRTAAPTTAAEFHIVPADYDAGFIDVDTLSCMRCHETANRHVRDFQAGRDWYGRIRGCDGIFSFHPFSRACISTNGYPLDVQLRKELVDAGWLAAHDPEKHSAGIYKRIEGLDQ